MISYIPTRQLISDTWDAYAKLCQAAAKDPVLASDSDYQSARDSAHKRWSEAFMLWDGK